MSNKLEYILKDYIFHIEKVMNYSPNTIVSYKRDLNSFLLFCKKIKIDNISFLDEKIVRDFVSHLHRNGIGPKSIKRSLSSLRSFFNFMLKKNIIKINFADNVRSPKAEKNLPEILQHSDIDLLANYKTKKSSYYKNNDLLVRDVAIFELFYSSGLRLSELAGIKFSNISFKESMLRVTEKGNKTTMVPIGSKAISAMKLWSDIGDSYIKDPLDF